VKSTPPEPSTGAEAPKAANANQVAWARSAR
jgi:hypothetical protein